MKEINNFIDIIYYAYMKSGLNIKKNKYKKDTYYKCKVTEFIYITSFVK